MNISDIIASKGATIGTLDERQTLQDAIEFMQEVSIGSVVITGGRSMHPVGIVSQSEIAAAIAKLGPLALTQCLSGIMRTTSFLCMASDSVLSAMAYMTRNRVRHLVAVDADGSISGLVSMGDFVAARLKSAQLEADVLRDMARTFTLVG